MILFTVGIIVTMGVFFSFTSVRGEVEDFVEKEQIEETGFLVKTAISEAYKTGHSNTIDIQIPKKINEKMYTIVLESVPNPSLRVELGEKSVSLGLASMEANFIGSKITSSKGRGKIIYDGKNIKLGR